MDKSRDVAGKPRDAAVNFDRYGVCRQLFFSLILLEAVDAATVTCKSASMLAQVEAYRQWHMIQRIGGSATMRSINRAYLT